MIYRWNMIGKQTWYQTLYLCTQSHIILGYISEKAYLNQYATTIASYNFQELTMNIKSHSDRRQLEAFDA